MLVASWMLFQVKSDVVLGNPHCETQGVGKNYLNYVRKR